MKKRESVIRVGTYGGGGGLMGQKYSNNITEIVLGENKFPWVTRLNS